MGSLQERLIEIADEINNDAEFARIAKVSRSAVSQWRAGDVKSLKALSAVNIQERTGYSTRWLVLGIGPKKLSSKNDNVEKPAEKSDSQNRLGPKNAQKLLVVVQSFLDTDDEGRNEIVAAVTAVTGENGTAGHQHSRHKRRLRA